MSCDTPNIERIYAAFEHRKLDRVPNFEILIEDRHTSRLLGRAVGHTLGSAKGASEDEYVAPPMDVRDYIEICRFIGQDAVGMEALWAPLKKKGDDGKLHIITDGSVHTWEQLDRVVPHSRELDIEPGVTTKDGLFSLETVACIGACSIAPVLTVNGKFHGRLDTKSVEKIVKALREEGAKR